MDDKFYLVVKNESVKGQNEYVGHAVKLFRATLENAQEVLLPEQLRALDEMDRKRPARYILADTPFDAKMFAISSWNIYNPEESRPVVVVTVVSTCVFTPYFTAGIVQLSTEEAASMSGTDFKVGRLLFTPYPQIMPLPLRSVRED